MRTLPASARCPPTTARWRRTPVTAEAAARRKTRYAGRHDVERANSEHQRRGQGGVGQGGQRIRRLIGRMAQAVQSADAEHDRRKQAGCEQYVVRGHQHGESRQKQRQLLDAARPPGGKSEKRQRYQPADEAERDGKQQERVVRLQRMCRTQPLAQRGTDLVGKVSALHQDSARRNGVDVSLVLGPALDFPNYFLGFESLRRFITNRRLGCWHRSCRGWAVQPCREEKWRSASWVRPAGWMRPIAWIHPAAWVIPPAWTPPAGGTDPAVFD